MVEECNWIQAASARGGQGLLAACNLRLRARVRNSNWSWDVRRWKGHKTGPRRRAGEPVRVNLLGDVWVLEARSSGLICLCLQGVGCHRVSDGLGPPARSCEQRREEPPHLPEQVAELKCICIPQKSSGMRTRMHGGASHTCIDYHKPGPVPAPRD